MYCTIYIYICKFLGVLNILIAHKPELTDTFLAIPHTHTHDTRCNYQPFSFVNQRQLKFKVKKKIEAHFPIEVWGFTLGVNVTAFLFTVTKTTGLCSSEL